MPMAHKCLGCIPWIKSLSFIRFQQCHIGFSSIESSSVRLYVGNWDDNLNHHAWANALSISFELKLGDLSSIFWCSHLVVEGCIWSVPQLVYRFHLFVLVDVDPNVGFWGLVSDNNFLHNIFPFRLQSNYIACHISWNTNANVSIFSQRLLHLLMVLFMETFFFFFRIAFNYFFENGSRIAIVRVVVVYTKGANFDQTWWYASWACEKCGVYLGCGRPQLELPFVINMYWFVLNWGGPTYIGDCIDYGWVVAIYRNQANLNRNVWCITTFVRQTTSLPTLIASSLDIFANCLLNPLQFCNIQQFLEYSIAISHPMLVDNFVYLWTIIILYVH
jgi:hypothetical protein